MEPKLRLDALWRHCRLTDEALREPIVACELGRLYNRESILHFKLTKAEQTEDRLALLSHVRGLKDVTTLKLRTNPGAAGSDDASPFTCPVLTDVEMNGHYPFVYYRKCGCTVSERAYKEAPSPNCLSCDQPYGTAADVILLCPGVAAEAELRVAMQARRKAAKDAKRASKKEKSLMPAPALPGAVGSGVKGANAGTGPSAGVVAGAGVRDGSAASANGGNSSKRKAEKEIEARANAKAARLKPTIRIGGSALTAIRALPPTVKDDDRGSKIYKSLFTSARKDPTKNLQNASIGSYTARTTTSIF